jgi:hypothetical protein
VSDGDWNPVLSSLPLVGIFALSLSSVPFRRVSRVRCLSLCLLPLCFPLCGVCLQIRIFDLVVMKASSATRAAATPSATRDCSRQAKTCRATRSSSRDRTQVRETKRTADSSHSSTERGKGSRTQGHWASRIVSFCCLLCDVQVVPVAAMNGQQRPIPRLAPRPLLARWLRG